MTAVVAVPPIVPLASVPTRSTTPASINLPPTLSRPSVIFLLLRAPSGAPGIISRPITLSYGGIEPLMRASRVIVRAIALAHHRVQASLRV